MNANSTNAVGTETGITEEWGPLCEAVFQEPRFWQIAAAIAILALLLVLIAKVRRWRKGVQLTDSDSGEVRISTAALHDLVTSACRQMDIVRKPKVHFRTEGGRLHLHAKVRLAAGRNISQVYEEMKRELTSTLEETLGSDRIGLINVTIVGFEKARRKSTPIYSNAKPKQETDELSEDPFDEPLQDEENFDDEQGDRRDETPR